VKAQFVLEIGSMTGMKQCVVPPLGSQRDAIHKPAKSRLKAELRTGVGFFPYFRYAGQKSLSSRLHTLWLRGRDICLHKSCLRAGLYCPYWQQVREFFLCFANSQNKKALNIRQKKYNNEVLHQAVLWILQNPHMVSRDLGSPKIEATYDNLLPVF